MVTVDTLLRLAGDLARAELVKKNFSHFEIDKVMDVIVSLGWRPATPAPESPAPAPYFTGDKLTPTPSQPDPALDRARAAVKAEYEKKKAELRSALGSDIGTDLGETFMRLGGDLARAEKQFRECLPAQYDRALEIMRQAGDRWRDHIDSMIASQRRMVEVGTGSETSPDAGASRDAAGLDDLLVVWRDNGEALITTRKYPDDTGVNGAQCWPKGISGYYLATHCRKPIIHPSARALLAKPAEASEAEQIPHPVAEAEQSPLPAGPVMKATQAMPCTYCRGLGFVPEIYDALQPICPHCCGTKEEPLPWRAPFAAQPPEPLDGARLDKASRAALDAINATLNGFPPVSQAEIISIRDDLAAALAQAPTRNAGEGK